MKEYKYIFGPIPSRRMGNSLGISPIEKRSCTYSCVYCQLGRTKNLMKEPKKFFETEDILEEFRDYLKENIAMDVVTVVGEGEPTLSYDLEELIIGLKNLTEKPVAVITNGSMLVYDRVRKALKAADIVLPSLDAGNETTFKRINRPNGKINFNDVTEALVKFSKEYRGQLWMETMIVDGFNDSTDELKEIRKILDKVRYDRLYINTPVRPPAEGYVNEPSKEKLDEAIKILKGTSIQRLSSGAFFSEIKDDFEAIKSIISRHPMNKFEVKSFLESRKCKNEEEIFDKFKRDDDIEVVEYKNYSTYRLK
ncbi:radical SAM protein [Clostridium felsineum]|uniref:GTP 3',8-cyclase n=1 Tax=Clostridium felsineum TaxID=36839 RepID=A0A1S8LFV8_9CLOT|nr:radical SAM protein [Clostridium felsineum]URZ06882.1 GTP 3',8-cyclase [Clostridium felsineum]URZ11914.1 GTP 3',8-cyclase [Clostridium felsineum]